ncbi:plakophilin-1-like [Synchiropus splendidus]|uniref:plakophilin-1-like n=1 Tax=Synchiropus splendidus TaxID=270530 RepID=UPI00237D947C|nr:plakophilin-1-like [Synchiropus splendidus]
MHVPLPPRARSGRTRCTPAVRRGSASAQPSASTHVSEPLCKPENAEDMTSQYPLKSALAIGNVDDTSLALPSANQQLSRERRVMEQVLTIKKTKARLNSSRSGSTSLSPASPSYESVFTDVSRSGASNGPVFFGNGFSKTLSREKSVPSSPLHNKSSPNFYMDRGYGTISTKTMTRMDTCRSEPSLAWPRPVSYYRAPAPQHYSSGTTYRGAERATRQLVTGSSPQPLQLQVKTNGTQAQNKGFISGKLEMREKQSTGELPLSKSQRHSVPNGNVTKDLTMKEAVEYLSNQNELFKCCGASYIQHNTFVDEKAKDEVLRLNGIPPLVAMLHDSNPQVSQAASAALRNISFKNVKNKEEIHRCLGVEGAVTLLKETDSAETQRQLTGLLWNLSSADTLKPDLAKIALPVLVEKVIVPCSTHPDSSSSEIFFNATGCLRNLSSAKQNNRQAMRKHPGLIDSLVTYVNNCVEQEENDDKSVENCVCILHNLTFQLENEAPTLFNKYTTLAKAIGKSPSQGDTGPIGCFSPQGKGSVPEHQLNLPIVEDPKPSGAGWLIHSKTLQNYLALLGSSQREETQEACCGAMHNLIARDGIVSMVMSQIIVQKLKGMHVIGPLLRSNKVNLQRSSMALLGNLCKNPTLHGTLARKGLPELLAVISAGTSEGNESDDTLAMACQTSNSLLLKDSELSKHLITSSLIRALNDLSQNRYFPKSSKAAALLLHNLWSDKEIQSYLKKQGMSKASFVNDVTTAAHKSVQVVD